MIIISGRQGFATEPEMSSNLAASSRKDSVKIRNHSPRMATIMSTVLPGLGQIYNRKYWKVPIIYAGGATIIYFINDFNNEYYGYRTSLNQYLNDEEISDPYFAGRVDRLLELGIDPTDALTQGRDYYRKYRDLNVIFLGGLYVLNIIDAMVDAHLFTFDVSDDLSMNIHPAGFKGIHSSAVGLSLCINF